MLGFINRNFSFKNKDVILPLCISLVRAHLEYAVQFCSPHHAKDIAKLEAVQRRATKVTTSLRNKSYEERLVSKSKLVLSRNDGSVETSLSVTKYLKDLQMWTQISCSQLITQHEQGITG